MKTEIELKLETTSEGMAQIRRHPVITRYKQGRAKSQLLRSVYFDTPDACLAKDGISLRVRHIGTKRIQTIKLAKTNENGAAFTREEWERPLSGDTPDPALLVESGVAARIAGLEDGRNLIPLFVTTIRRTTYCLAGDGWSVEVALDSGTIENLSNAPPKQGSVSLCEVELELIAGDPKHLFSIAQSLNEKCPLRLNVVGKSDRGYRLLGLLQPKPIKPGSTSLSARMSPAEGMRAILRDCFRHFLHNADVLRATQAPEAIHQMRVALRRIRSAFVLFRPLSATPRADVLRREIGWLARELGEARDLDVFLAEIIAPATDALTGLQPEASDGLKQVSTLFQRRRNDGYARANRALESQRCDRFLLDLATWIEGDDDQFPSPTATEVSSPASLGPRLLRDLALERLVSLREKTLRRGRHFGSLDPLHLHRVRIEVKKLRYAVEFFSTLFPRKSTRAFIKAMTALQDDLGRLNDINVAYSLLRTLSETPRKASAVSERHLAFYAGMIAGWHHVGEKASRSHATDRWREFAKARPFWGSKS